MIYLHLCEKCEKEFELEYSMKEDPPKDCPLEGCGGINTVKRLISCTWGRVELGDREWADKVREDAGKLKREAYRNEECYADLLGHSNYENNLKRR